MCQPPLESGLTCSTSCFGPPHIQQPGNIESRALSCSSVNGRARAPFRCANRALLLRAFRQARLHHLFPTRLPGTALPHLMHFLVGRGSPGCAVDQ